MLTKKLNLETFIKKSNLLDEALHAMPVNPPSIVQQNKLNPSYWYHKLNLPQLEQDFDLPNKILLHIIDIESKGNPNAESNMGAKGLFGVIPGKSGFKGDINNPKETAIFVAKTLRYLIDYFGSVEKALAAYNWGIGNLAKKGLHNAPNQTKHYLNFFRQKQILPNGSDINMLNKD